MQGQAVFEELSLNKCVLEKIRLDIKHFARKCQLDKSVLRTYTAEKKTDENKKCAFNSHCSIRMSLCMHREIN